MMSLTVITVSHGDQERINLLIQTQLQLVFLCCIAMITSVKLNSNEGDLKQYYASNLIESAVVLQ
jgi:hypothetical protein